jgi:archaellum component FlaC
MTNLESFINELNQNNEEFKMVKMFVPNVNKEVDFVMTLYKHEINEYVFGLDTTQEEMEEINFWLSEEGGADLLAKSVGLVDTHYTF